MPSNVNISRIKPQLVLSASGLGPSEIYFQKDPVPSRQGEPGSYAFVLNNVAGTFTALLVNVEVTANLQTPFWETAANWNPLTQPMLICPCTEGFFYRLNVTGFTGGTSFDVWAAISNTNTANSTTQSSGGTVDQGTGGASPWLVSIAGQPIEVVGTFPGGIIDTQPGAPAAANWSSLPVSVSSAGGNVLVAGVGGKTVRVMRIFFVNSSSPPLDTMITLQDDTPTDLSGVFPLLVNGQFSGDGDGEPLYVTASGKGFQVYSTEAVQLSGTIWFSQS